MLKDYKVILHGCLATVKDHQRVDGKQCAIVWQGSSRYVVPISELVLAR